MEQRVITEREEQAYRLCHHDFEGLTVGEAAERMGVTQPVVSKLLASVQRKAPQLFPILTQQQARVRHYICVEGWSTAEIAEHMELSVKEVERLIRAVRAKGIVIPDGRGQRQRPFQDYMSDDIEEKF